MLTLFDSFISPNDAITDKVKNGGRYQLFCGGRRVNMALGQWENQFAAKYVV